MRRDIHDNLVFSTLGHGVEVKVRSVPSYAPHGSPSQMKAEIIHSMNSCLTYMI